MWERKSKAHSSILAPDMWQDVVDKKMWNGAVSQQASARFLQSWEWGEFQASLGRRVARLSWNDAVLVQAIQVPLPLSKHYWYIPHGPVVIKESAPKWSKSLREKLHDGALFVRVDPVIEIPPLNPPLSKGGEIDSTQPRCTRVMDLNQSEDDLLEQMHQKTRYNIRLAEKKGVSVSEGSVEDFIRLNHETKARDRFASHPDEYYRTMAASLPKDFVKIWQATYQNQVVASNISITFGDTATYAHGASSNQHRDAMAPYLLHWRIIQDAKKRGIRYYDLWGANPENPRHEAYKKSWQGLTRFKAGFGGTLACYPRSFDVIHNTWLYIMYTIARRIHRMI